MYDFTVEEDRRGNLYLTAVHHDGRNYFELYRLSERGLDFYSDGSRYDYDRETLCQQLAKKGYHKAARVRQALKWV